MLRRARGFTLVETLAALLVFTLVTLGVLPLLASSLRGATLARSYTIGRNLAQQAMERVRGLPYHVGFSTQPTRVDVLDLYYPTAQTDGLATTVCDATTTANPACLRNLATDYSITFEAAFVPPAAPGTVLVAPTDYPTSYAWNSATDAPPSQLLRMTVTASWDVGGVERDYSIQSLISDRRFGDLKFSGTSSLDYLVRATGSFFEGGEQADLIAEIGSADATIESKLQSSAEQVVRAATLTLLDLAGLEVSPAVSGGETTVRVPPQANVIDPGQSDLGDAGVLVHGSRTVASIQQSLTDGVKAGVAAEVPYADGAFTLATGAPAGVDFWIADQSSPTVTEGPLALDAAGHFLEIVDTEVASDVAGETTAGSTSLGSGNPETVTTATGSLRQLRLFPLATARIPDRTYGGAVVVLRDFVSEVRCASTGTTNTEAVATWSATMSYWTEPDDGVSGGGAYVNVPLAGTLGADPLAALKSSNPLVWEAPEPVDDGDPATVEPSLERDVYLFKDAANGRLGYLQDWSSESDVSTTGVQEETEEGGVETSAKIPGAVSLSTVAPDPASSTGLSVEIGSLSCRSVEFRV